MLHVHNQSFARGLVSPYPVQHAAANAGSYGDHTPSNFRLNPSVGPVKGPYTGRKTRARPSMRGMPSGGMVATGVSVA